MAELRHSVAVTLSRISDKLHLVYRREAVCCFKFHGMNNTTTSTHQQVLAKGCPGDSWHLACCKLAPTLASQMRRHNYVIDRN